MEYSSTKEEEISTNSREISTDTNPDKEMNKLADILEEHEDLQHNESQSDNDEMSIENIVQNINN